MKQKTPFKLEYTGEEHTPAVLHFFGDKASLTKQQLLDLFTDMEEVARQICLDFVE